MSTVDDDARPAVRLALSSHEASELVMALEDHLSDLRMRADELPEDDGGREWRIRQAGVLGPVLGRLTALAYPDGESHSHASPLDDEALDVVLDRAIALCAAMKAGAESEADRELEQIGQEFLSCFVGHIAQPTHLESLGVAAERGRALILARLVARGPLCGPRKTAGRRGEP